MLYNGEVKLVADQIALPIPLGALCCFKPLGNDNVILFGHIAGVMVKDFETMTFVYIMKCGDRNYYSADVIEKPNNVETAEAAKRYFRMYRLSKKEE